MSTGVSATQLAGLFLGDRDSLGYFQQNLIYELCQRTRPGRFDDLRDWLFGASALIEEIDPVAMETALSGYQSWKRSL